VLPDYWRAGLAEHRSTWSEWCSPPHGAAERARASVGVAQAEELQGVAPGDAGGHVVVEARFTHDAQGDVVIQKG